MTAILAIACIVMLSYLLRMIWPYLHYVVRNNVRYSYSGIVDLPPASVREALDEFFRFRACVFELEKNGVRVYQRGYMTCFRVDHTMKWHAIPQMVGFGVASESGKTKVEIGYRVNPPARITDAAAKQFLECVCLESMRALEMLHAMACEGGSDHAQPDWRDESGTAALPAD